MNAPVYLDHNATTPIRPEAAEAVVRALGITGNASSVHGFGRTARKLIEDARETVADFVGADPSGVIFTAGGSEANALALTGFGQRRLVVSAIEHASVLEAATAETVPVDANGVIDLVALEKMLATGAPAHVALMLANNETGVLQPVAPAAEIAHAHGATVHCDAVQAAGHIAIDLKTLGVDSLSLSAHKVGGPQGVGALALAAPSTVLTPLIKGGGHEGGRRAGTENLSGIAGFAAALRVASKHLNSEAARQSALRDGLETGVARIAPGMIVFGADAVRLPNTSCLGLEGMTARRAVIALDLAGVAVSAGAACAAGKARNSHVLKAMGAGAMSGSAIRVSLGWNSTEEDVKRFLDAFAVLVGRLADAA